MWSQLDHYCSIVYQQTQKDRRSCCLVVNILQNQGFFSLHGTLGYRTKSNSRVRLSSTRTFCEFDFRTSWIQSKNRTEPVRQPNRSIEEMDAFDCVRWVHLLERRLLCGLVNTKNTSYTEVNSSRLEKLVDCQHVSQNIKSSISSIVQLCLCEFDLVRYPNWIEFDWVRLAMPGFLGALEYMSGFMKTVLKNLPPITHISPWFHCFFRPPPSHVKGRK